MIDAFRNLRSRALRTALTVAGIAIGVIALVVVGALAERLHEIVGRSQAVTGGTIFAQLQGRTLFDPSAPERVQRARGEIAALPGVRAVLPEVVLPYRLGFGDDGRFGPPSLILGFSPEARKIGAETLTLEAGRDLGAGEAGSAVIGSDFATAEKTKIGEVISLYGNSFVVVGRLAKSFTIFDAAVIVALPDAQALYPQTLPPSLPFVPKANVTGLMIVTKAGADSGRIARRVSLIPGFSARDPKAVASDIASTTKIFDSIIFGSALVALLIGSFSIVNTMTIAVTERTREIGIRKAIGAGDGDILREFLVEAATIGALGGAIGLALGTAIVAYVNARNASGGNLELFAVTPRLALGAFGFAVVLSALAGLLPAIRAARLDPTVALRRTL